jgi:hypothetical protein
VGALIPAAAILAECERRGYIEPQTLAVLTLAIDEDWTAIPAGFFQQLDNQAHFTIDPWYNLAHLRGHPAPEWQDFKSLLYRHIRAAKDIYDGAPIEEDPVSALTVPLAQNADGTWTSPSPAWAHLIMRESSGNPTIIQQITDVNSGGNEAEGLFQITPRTWDAHGGQEFAPSPRRATPQQQAIVAARIFTANPSGSDWGAGRPGREDAQQLAAGLIPTDQGAPPVTDPNRPDFNEYPMWSPNNSGRNGRKVDLFLLHTQEGDGNADSLAHFLQGNEVSYHYTISEDYNDHGVTVVDVVDTDSASWSVLSANPRSINLCFAGSRAAWSRADWLKQSRAIDVAAYIAVQDCKKYGIPLKVLAPPYTGASATSSGISDHNYVTEGARRRHTHRRRPQLSVGRARWRSDQVRQRCTRHPATTRRSARAQRSRLQPRNVGPGTRPLGDARRQDDRRSPRTDPRQSLRHNRCR